MSVSECQSRVSSAEFVEWLAFDELSPGEPERGDIRNALLAWVVYMMNTLKGGCKLELKDFLLKFKDAETKENEKAKVSRSKSFWRGLIKKGKS